MPMPPFQGSITALITPFKNGEVERDYLAALLRAFDGYAVAVELRHRTWSDALPDTLEVLNSFGAAWVQIDEPKFRMSIRQNYLPNVRGFYYLRLHGRNAAQWWHHERAEDRYNYLYSGGELQEFTDTLDAARRIVKKAYLYMNNHFAAKSVANAVAVKHLAGEAISGDFPPELIERYPFLKPIVGEGSAQAVAPATRKRAPRPVKASRRPSSASLPLEDAEERRRR